MTRRPLSERHAIITGASRGIGAVIARHLARAGVDLILAARDYSALAALAEELRATGVQVIPVEADLTDAGDRLNLVKRARAEFGSVDILVNNAGVEQLVRFDQQDAGNIQRILDLNLAAPVLLTRLALPEMRERGSGHVINIASLAGRTSMPFGAVYSGSKGGLAEWSISLAGELDGSGVDVTVICPGFVAGSGMFARKGRDAPGTLGTATPDQVAAAVISTLQRPQIEMIVNPRPVRLLMALRALSPRLALRLAKRLGLFRFLASLAAGRNGKDGMTS